MTFDYSCNTIEISPILALSQRCSALKTTGHCPQLVRGPSAPRLPGKKGPVRSPPGLDGQGEEETTGAQSSDCSRTEEPDRGAFGCRSESMWTASYVMCIMYSACIVSRSIVFV